MHRLPGSLFDGAGEGETYSCFSLHVAVFRKKFRFTRRRIRGTIHSNRAFAMGDSFDPRKAIGDFIQKGDKKHDKGKKTGNH